MFVIRETNTGGGNVPERPRTRGDCADGPRPCPWVSCRFHLYLDVKPSGAIRYNRPDIAPDELERMPETCALDVADRGGHSFAAIGSLYDLTRERIRQIVERALVRLSPSMRALLEAMEPAPK